ncbi:MAG: L,D-transpeptidase, partial [Chitinispirillia bacterium]|nr:L,D-transpeptidase [Chitinispirillia bacterium]
CDKLNLKKPDSFICVSIEQQTLYYYQKSILAATFTISTSSYGIGNKEGSNKTPLGLHRIENKIGEDAAPWTIFKSRENTGVIWQPGMNDENQILSRILRLRGLEEGVNAGAGIDSYDRYIYIHGTNHEEKLGTPMSHGCVCMKNDDIIKMFHIVKEGTLVYIG